MVAETPPDLRAVEEIARARVEIKAEIEKRIVGQQDGRSTTCSSSLFARGHCLFVGVPGLAKTLLISTLADVLNLSLQPHPVHARPDAVGHHRHRRPRGGPGHRPARVPLRAAGRSSPTSSSPTRSTARRPRRRRRCCRRCRSTASRRRPDLRAAAAVPRVRHAEPDRAGGHLPAARGAARPLHVPGRRRLPVARRRRSQIVKQHDQRRYQPTLKKVLSPERILALQELVLRVPVADHVVRYAVALVRAHAAPRSRALPTSCAKNVSWGAGPRASQYLVLGGQGARDPRRPLRGRASRTCGRWPRPCCSTACCPTSTPRREGITARAAGRSAARTREAVAPRPHGAARRPDAVPAARTWSCAPARSSRARSPACTARRTTARRVEFAEHKEYAPGDEIRHIDWKAYGKFDKYYVKRFEEETELRAYLLVDCSASMGYAGGSGVSKLDYATLAGGGARRTCCAAAGSGRHGRVRARGCAATCRRARARAPGATCWTRSRRSSADGRDRPRRARSPIVSEVARRRGADRAVLATCSTTGNEAVRHLLRGLRARARRRRCSTSSTATS